MCCCLGPLRAHASVLRGQHLHCVEVASGIFVSQGAYEQVSASNLGAIANVGFIVGGERVAVIDSGGCALWGQRLRQAIRARTQLPISHLIHTHMHPDHVFGAAAFLSDNPRIVGHRNLPAALARRAGYYRRRLQEALGDLADGSTIVPPTELVESGLDIDLGGRSLAVTAEPVAHTDNDLSILDRRTGTLWAGDLLFMERVPALDGSLLGWLAVMETLSRLPAARVVPGHGPHVAEWPAALAPQQRYLSLLRDEIRAVIRRGGTMEDAVASVGQSEAGNWALFADYNPRNATAAFHELEWE